MLQVTLTILEEWRDNLATTKRLLATPISNAPRHGCIVCPNAGVEQGLVEWGGGTVDQKVVQEGHNEGLVRIRDPAGGTV